MADVHDDLVSFGTAIAHTLAPAAVVAAFFGYMPAVAALVAFAWYLIQIYESKTFQTLVARLRARRIAKLERNLLELRKKHEHRRSDP